uniref:LRRCT domain-containing protein n=1 Tax=Parascaris equorum TaxID=6256 RepID=A0A914RJG9_PAREQ
MRALCRKILIDSYVFSDLPRLSELSFNGALAEVLNLKRLNLSANLVEILQWNEFPVGSHLRSVDIRNNRLNRIDHTSFAVDNLSSGSSIQLYVEGNPLICSCEMDWLRRSASSVTRLTHSQPLPTKHAKSKVIHRPHLQGKSVIEIVDEQQATCLHRIDKRQITLAHVTRDEFLCSYRQVFFEPISKPSCE